MDNFSWKSIEVDSWEQLLTALHTSEMIPECPNEGNHRRSPYLFRGMADSSWRLETSLERKWPAAQSVEGPSLRAFGKYAKAGTLASHSDWDRLAIAQHNGLPTRCLDWTASPLIAAHFATAESEHFDKDGVIWCVDAVSTRDNLLSPAMLMTLERELAFVFDVPSLEKYWPELRVFDDSAEDLLLFFEPPSIDDRIHNQYGLLSVMNGPTKSHDAFLRRHLPEYPSLVRRVIIRSSAKQKIRDMLDQNNITERMLFPGLPGLCQWLLRYYGPATSRNGEGD
ncbi:MAG: FRG domain-containing protein [Deltaproteobacteria bacterium]|nr:FRG domain-containing protein [Deltaproteobacteria bacterium]